MHVPLAILPDPLLLSLEETLELRQILSDEGHLKKWWEAVADAINRMQRQGVSREHNFNLQQPLQDTASPFRQNWPSAEDLGLFLHLEAVSYPALTPHLAFALASGLPSIIPARDSSEVTYGVTLLLSPTEAP